MPPRSKQWWILIEGPGSRRVVGPVDSWSEARAICIRTEAQAPTCTAMATDRRPLHAAANDDVALEVSGELGARIDELVRQCHEVYGVPTTPSLVLERAIKRFLAAESAAAVKRAA
jgi:hypothetical protein